MKVVDANVFIRYLTGDDAAKQHHSEELITRIRDGEEEALTTEIIVHEVCFVLTSSRHYNATHQAVRDRLTPLLQMQGLHVANKSLCLDALDLFARSEKLDVSDAFSIALVQQHIADSIYSYDQHLDRISGAQRLEPRRGAESDLSAALHAYPPPDMSATAVRLFLRAQAVVSCRQHVRHGPRLYLLGASRSGALITKRVTNESPHARCRRRYLNKPVSGGFITVK